MKRSRASLKAALVLGAVLALAGVIGVKRSLGGEQVAVTEVAEGSLVEVVRAPAQVEARVQVALGARVTSEIEEVAVDIGDPVRAGDLLVRLDDREALARVAAARAKLDRARADLALAESSERRDREVFEAGHITPAAMEATTTALLARKAEIAAAEQDLRVAQTQAGYATLTAPMDAIVVARLAEPGDTVVPGASILRLADPTTLQVVALVDEAAAGRVEPGMPVDIRLRAGGEHPGRVARIRLEADAAARELPVEIAFDALPPRFAIHQEAEVSIQVATHRGRIIPLSALLRREGQPGVLVVREGRARFQPIGVGALGETGLIVEEGLEAGDLIVAAALSVPAGARVRAAAED